MKLLWLEAGKVNFQDVADVGQEVRFLQDDGHGHLWIATSDAIFSYDLVAKKLRKRASSLGGVTAMKWADASQRLYFIVSQSDLNVLDAARGQVRKVVESKASDYTSLAVSSKGEVWLGTRLGDVFHYDAMEGL